MVTLLLRSFKKKRNYCMLQWQALSQILETALLPWNLQLVASLRILETTVPRMSTYLWCSGK